MNKAAVLVLLISNLVVLNICFLCLFLFLSSSLLLFLFHRHVAKLYIQCQCEHMVNRVSSYFPKGGHSATETELKNNINTRKVKRHRNSDTKTGNREQKKKLPPWNGQ